MPSGRNYEDWIAKCVSAKQGDPIPETFRWWAALTAVSAALQKRCFYDAGIFICYPSMLNVLIGTPGSGKTTAMIQPFSEILQPLTEPLTKDEKELEQARLGWERYYQYPEPNPLHIIDGDVTAEMLYVYMEKIECPVYDLLDAPPDASMLIKTTEFGAFMTRNNSNLQVLMTKGWDGDPGSHHTKNYGVNIVPGICITWMAAATPGQFILHMPDASGEQGLLSRVIPIVYTGPDMKEDERKITRAKPIVLDQLSRDLGHIASLTGIFRWEDGLYDTVIWPWHEGGKKPLPTDPLMIKGYNGRRYSHLLKMCMALSASRGDSLVMTKADWDIATARLFEAERHMPGLYRRFGMHDAGMMADALIQFLHSKGGFCSAAVLKREAMRLARSVHEIEPTLTMLLETNQIMQEESLYHLPKK